MSAFQEKPATKEGSFTMKVSASVKPAVRARSPARSPQLSSGSPGVAG